MRYQPTSSKYHTHVPNGATPVTQLRHNHAKTQKGKFLFLFLFSSSNLDYWARKLKNFDTKPSMLAEIMHNGWANKSHQITTHCRECFSNTHTHTQTEFPTGTDSCPNLIRKFSFALYLWVKNAARFGGSNFSLFNYSVCTHDP